MRGRFISFEGVDRCGKSTQAQMLAAYLEERGERVVLTREPGGTPAGERIRDALLATESLTPLAEAHLFAAARAELVATVIAPALDAGRWVVCDRFVDSSLAYQGVARGLGLDAIWELNRAAVGDCLPDRTILLTLQVSDAAARRAAVDDDRIEREGDGLQRAVAEGYRTVAERFPDRIVRVDAAGTRQHVHERVVAALP